MLRSRSRSGSVDFGQKNQHSSIFSKKIYASKFCRGDSIAAQIDATALKPISNFSEMREMEEELRNSKEQMNAIDIEKSRVLEELETLKKTMSKKIESLELELSKSRQDESDKDASLGRLMKELRDVRERESHSNELVSENTKRIQELEAELERKRMTESRMTDSLLAQNRQLDSALFELEESKIEIASLHEKIDGLEDLCNHISKGNSNDEELARAKENEKRALLKAESLSEEIQLLKKEMKFAIEGENKSADAMDDLAMALKEVATEANRAKELLSLKEDEVNEMKKILMEAQQETEEYKKTTEKLRTETEETLFAWNAKEIGFMSCIKRAEEERAVAQIENHKLSESLKAAENMTRAAREETYKLRDILKQAINESNAAKAAAGIARDENSLLKDCLAEKEEALHFITKENERLRISEAAAQEHVKQLKRMLTMASTEIKIDDTDKIGFVMFTDEDEERIHKKMTREFSFDLEDLKFMNELDEGDVLDEDPEKAEALKGSIFDTTAETPKSEARTPKATFSRVKSHSPEGDDHDLDHDHDHEDGEGDKQQAHRRSKTMFQRVGGLLTIRKSVHKKDPSADHKLTTPTQTSAPHL